MVKLNVRQILQIPTFELWQCLTGPITLVFDDASEVETNDVAVIYSSHAWELFREYPNTPILPKHLSDKHTKGGYITASTHRKLLKGLWSVYDHIVENTQLTYEQEQEIRMYLKRRVAEIFNYIYNAMTIRLEPWVTSLDILDCLEVHEHPLILEANEKLLPTQRSIDKAYKVLHSVLSDPKELVNNAVAHITRSEIANKGQVNQGFSSRGFLTESDSNIFPDPIIVSHFKGIHSLHDSMIESCLAKKSLSFSKEPLQQAEYFSRRLQLLLESLQNLHPGDCGSNHYVLWHVRPKRLDKAGGDIEGDLRNLRGIYYLNEQGKLDWIRGHETHLENTLIKIRNPVGCQHEDPYGICSVCFGQLSKSHLPGSNLGQYCWTYVAEKSSQAVLSVKHYDGSSVVDGIVLPDEYQKYLRVDGSRTSYMLGEGLKGKKLKLIISSQDATGINDLWLVDNVRKLPLTSIVQTDEVGIEEYDELGQKIVSLSVGMKGRLASLSYPFLNHLKQKGYDITSNNCVSIDLEGWDWDVPFLTLPLKHYNMSEHSKDISRMIESRIGDQKMRDTDINIQEFLVEFFDLVNSKLSINLAVLSVVVYGAMIVSAADHNYSFPKPDTLSGLGVGDVIMARRSLSALLAYEFQKANIVNPISYLGTNRMPHILDDVFMPELLNTKDTN